MSVRTPNVIPLEATPLAVTVALLQRHQCPRMILEIWRPEGEPLTFELGEGSNTQYVVVATPVDRLLLINRRPFDRSCDQFIYIPEPAPVVALTNGPRGPLLHHVMLSDEVTELIP